MTILDGMLNIVTKGQQLHKDQIIEVELSKLVRSSQNNYPLEEIEELAEDMAINGLYHNLVVRPLTDGRYEIISGERRSLAARIKSTGTKKIDYMINTHPDADHVGGLATIMKEFSIGRLCVSNGDSDTKTYRNFIETAANLGLSPEVLLENSKFVLDDCSVTFFNTKATGKNNDVSLITLFENGNDKFLFTGDAGLEQESKFIDFFPDIDVLKIGHHGSKSSTSDKLIERTKPEYAVILAGVGNTYGHPHKEVIDRLNKYKVKTYRTDIDGTIIFESTGKGVDISKLAKLVSSTTISVTSKAFITSKKPTNSTSKAKVITSSTIASKSSGIIITPSGKEISSTYKFKNCDEVRQYFPSGFGKTEYPDLYAVNTARDGDKDGWACE